MADIEKLIELVRERRLLYDLSDNDYKNRDKKAEAWLQIAREMGTEDGKCMIRCYIYVYVLLVLFYKLFIKIRNKLFPNCIRCQVASVICWLKIFKGVCLSI